MTTSHIIEESTAGDLIDSATFAEPILLPDTSTHFSESSGSLRRIRLTDDVPLFTTIVPGTIFGSMVFPVELDENDDAVLSPIRGFNIALATHTVGYAFESSSGGVDKEMKSELFVGTTSEPFNSATITLQDTLDWRTDPLLDYTEYFHEIIAVEKPIWASDSGTLTANVMARSSSWAGTTTVRNRTTLDLFEPDGGLFDEEITALVVYGKFGDDSFTRCDFSWIETGYSSNPTAQQACIYFTEANSP